MSKLNELDYKTIIEIRKLLDSKSISSYELCEHFLKRTEDLDKYGIFITPPSESILKEATTADEIIKYGKEIHLLTGIPVPIKDMDPVKGLPFTHGSLPYKNNIANDDSLVVKRIKNFGGIIAGKTNTPENGYAGTTENRLSKPSLNPWDYNCTSGGSSGGSAVAVAAGLIPFATGGDGGGSIRIPAGFTGIYGLKPSQGRVPKYQSGRKSYNISNISTSGALTRSVLDTAKIMSILSGGDPNSEYGAISQKVSDFSKNLTKDIKEIKIGWSETIGGNPVDSEVIEVIKPALNKFEELGAKVEEIKFIPDDFIDVFSTWFDYFCMKGLNGYKEDYLDNRNSLSNYFLEYLDHASSLTGERLWDIHNNIGWYRNYTNEYFDNFDLLITPSLAVPAFEVNNPPDYINSEKVAHRLWGFTPYTYLFNLTGNPAASIPVGFSSKGLPIGIQIVGEMFSEEFLLNVSSKFEEAKPWSQFKPINY